MCCRVAAVSLYDLVVFGDEPYGNYNRILLSSVLRAHTIPKIFSSTRWRLRHRTRGACMPAVRVLEIDRAAKQVRGENGIIESYDKLIIATGSSRFVPPVKGLYREDAVNHSQYL